MRWLYQLHCCFPSFPCLLGSVVLCCDRIAYCFHNCTSSNMLIPFVFCQLPTTLFQASVTTAIHATKITFCQLPTTWWHDDTVTHHHFTSSMASTPPIPAMLLTLLWNRAIVKQNQGTVGVQFFCTWLSLKNLKIFTNHKPREWAFQTSTYRKHKPKTETTKTKRTINKKEPYVSTTHGPPIDLFLFPFFRFLGRGFCNFCSKLPKPMDI